MRHSIGDKVHIWDGANIVADIDGSNVSVYIRGVNLIYADDGDKTYYHFNAHGDVVALTNESGTKTKSYSYNAFGVEYNETTLDDNPFRYCGEYYDKETQTIYLRARYYNAAQGRFTQEDPIRDGYNWYTYCYQNPLSYIDPNGMAAMDCLDFDDDPADGVDVISFGFCGGGGGGQVSPIISPYDSTSYSNNMARSNTARYDASLGGYYSGGISSATANPNYYALYYEPTVGDDQVVDTKENADSTNQSEAKYYSADVYGGKGWKKTSGPMTFEEAKTWAENTKKGSEPIPNTTNKYYGKGASWGVYTEYEVDARALGNALGQIDPRMDSVPSGFYQHYHLIGANGIRGFGKFAHFHVWFGPPMP